MTRVLMPGRWNRHGRAIPNPVPHPHLERVTLTELDLELPHDAYRVIAAPPKAAKKVRRRANGLALGIAAAALIAFGVLLLLFPHSAHSQALVPLSSTFNQDTQ